MNLSAPFIQRPVMTTLLMLAILFLGGLCYFQLPVSNLPDINFPVISVKAAFPGASPETMANSVATPLEKEFMTISGITNIASSNTLGQTSIVLHFSVDKDIDSAALDVEAAISRALSNLPPDLPNTPTFRKVNPGMAPIMYLALSSDTLPLSELYTYANTYIGQRLSMVEGVAKVITYGSPYAMRVQVDPNRLAVLGITLQEIASALQEGNPNLPTGRLDGVNRSATLATKGRLTNAEMFQPLIIAYKEGAPVRIRDVGQAIDGLKDDRMSLKYVNAERKEPAVVLAIQRQPNANTVAVARAIKKILPELTAPLPAAIRVESLFDQSFSIEESVFDVQLTLGLALLLVVLVIFFYLGNVRDTIIPALVLPLSIVGTFIAMYLLNYSLDSLSLLALTLAIGFIVDDAIVVLENIVKRVEQGETPWNASLNGSRQICFTILSMTLSLAAVFIPLLFMQGLLGKIFQEFAVTLAILTLISGFLSLTLTPMLCSRFLRPRKPANESGGLIALYKPCLEAVLKYRKTTLAFGLLSILLSLFFFKILPKDFIPDEDGGFIIAYNQAAQGTSSDLMAHYQDEVIQVLQKDPNIKSFVSIAAYPQTREGVNFIRLKPKKERISSQELIQKLYQKMADIPGVNTFFKNIPLIDLSVGTQTKGAFQYTLQSLDTAELYASAEKLLSIIQPLPVFQGVTSDLEMKMPQLNIQILRDQAAALGITAESIEQSLLLAYSGNRVSRIETPIDQYDVILELQRKYQGKPESLNSIFLRAGHTDKLTPLHAVAKWAENLGPSSVNHIAQLPSVTINFNVAPGIPLSEAMSTLENLAQEHLSPHVKGQFLGAAKTFQETIRSTGFLLILSILAIYLVLGILYESFIHPLTILSTLPPAILGGLLTLYLTGHPFSLYAFLGLILLIGIVKKNGIMLVDFALESKESSAIFINSSLDSAGKAATGPISDEFMKVANSPEKAITNACLARFRPIMMTTMAAIFGAIPIAFGLGAGADSLRPLGMVIIGGMLFSQAVTLLLTPVIYVYLDKLSKSNYN